MAEFEKNNVIMFEGKFNRVTLSAQGSGDGRQRGNKDTAIFAAAQK